MHHTTPTATSFLMIVVIYLRLLVTCFQTWAYWSYLLFCLMAWVGYLTLSQVFQWPICLEIANPPWYL